MKSSLSRRGLFKWIGQITAGVSLASIGLGIADPLKAFANPDCLPCRYCTVISCKCRPVCGHDLQHQCLVTYNEYSGCVPAGQQCPFLGTFDICQYSCSFSC